MLVRYTSSLRKIHARGLSFVFTDRHAKLAAARFSSDLDDLTPWILLLMLEYTRGNLLEARAEALVNTVNEVGVMGKGIALMFKERFPTASELYVRASKDGRVHVGHMLVTRTVGSRPAISNVYLAQYER